MAEATRFFENGDYQKAEIEYKNVLQAEALNPDAICQLGIIFFDEGRLRQSIPYLLKAVELKPGNLEVRRRLAQFYQAFGKTKEASEQARFILEHKPTDDMAPWILIEASLANPDDLSAAKQRLQQLPGGAADGAPVVVALGLIELRQKNIAAAEAAFKRAATLDPKFAAPHSALAGLYRIQKDPAKTEQEFKAAADLAPIRSGRMLQYAQFLIQNGKVADGRRALEELNEKAPDYLPAQSALAELAAADKKYDESATLAAKVLALDPDNPEAMLLSGRLKLAKGEPDKAVTELEKMVRVFPKSPQALYFLGLAYTAAGQQQKAIDQLTQSVRLAATPDAILALASLNLRKGDYSSVIVGLKPLVQQRPDNAQARLILAEAYRGQGNFEDALALYRQSEKELPNNAQASFRAGIVLLQEKKLAEARGSFEEALKRTPGFLPALEQLAFLDVAEKHPENATRRVEAELAKTPNSAGLHLLYAKVLLMQNDTSRGEPELKKVIELRPDATEAYLLLAQLYVRSGQQQKALVNLQAAATKNPKDPKPVLIIGMIEEQQKNYPAAREAYEKILSIDPKFSVALNNLAYLYSEQFNELDKAYDTAQKARELLPSEPHVADTLGWILYKKGQYARAEALLGESADDLPDQGEIRYHLGVTQYAMGQEAAAQASLHRALELSANASWAPDAKSRLAILAIDASKPTDAAVAELEKLRSERPADAVVLGRLATIYEGRGEIDKAIATCQSAVNANPTNAAPLVSLAHLFAAKKEPAKALEAAKSARKLAPDDLDVARSIGWIAYQAGEYAWAASLLQDAARKQTDDPELLYQAALAIYSVGKVSEAETMMHDALNPPSPVKAEGLGLMPNVLPGDAVPSVHPASLVESDAARSFLEMLEISAKPDASATAKVEAALKSNPTSVPALMALGAIQEQQADLAAARQTYEKALAVFPEFVPAKLHFAVVAAAQPQFDQKAYDWAQQARTAYPNDPNLAKALGILIYRKGDDDGRAAALLKQSSVARSSDPDLMYYLGMTQNRLKKNAESKVAFQRALELGLKGDSAAEAKRILAELK